MVQKIKYTCPECGKNYRVPAEYSDAPMCSSCKRNADLIAEQQRFEDERRQEAAYKEKLRVLEVNRFENERRQKAEEAEAAREAQRHQMQKMVHVSYWCPDPVNPNAVIPVNVNPPYDALLFMRGLFQVVAFVGLVFGPLAIFFGLIVASNSPVSKPTGITIAIVGGGMLCGGFSSLAVSTMFSVMYRLCSNTENLNRT